MKGVEGSIIKGQAGSQSLRSNLQVILANQDSRHIFYFLCLNLSYMFVQLAYGVWTNSLGLISDAIHMFFDCLALAVGLFASVMATWGANERYTYGYDRVEILSGFANGVFLVLISIFIMIEAVQRLLRPFEMNTDRLMLVSFMGLVVNMVGIFAFNHGHAHGHGHSHGGGGCGHEHGHNANMQAVFLHILADTLGSVGVIISTFLIQQFGWTGFDPVASIIIAALIFASVMPLIKSSAHILMNRPNAGAEQRFTEVVEKIDSIPGVRRCTLVKIWPVAHERFVATLHVRAAAAPGTAAGAALSGPAHHQHQLEDGSQYLEDEHRSAHNPNLPPDVVVDAQGILFQTMEIVRASFPQATDVCVQVEREGAGGFADFCPCRHERLLKQI